MKQKNLEIEKRLLLKRLPLDDSLFDEIQYIEQFYTPTGRYRKIELWNKKPGNLVTKYIHTIKKAVSKGVSEENEVEISLLEFTNAIKKTTKFISKNRYIKKAGKYKWEIDEFVDLCLIIAEIEVKTKKELKTVKLPKYIKETMILDVTGIKVFSNFNLAEKHTHKDEMRIIENHISTNH